MKEKLKKVKKTMHELYKAIYELEEEINKHIDLTKQIIIKIKEIRKNENDE